MTDPTTPDVELPEPPTKLQRSVACIVRFVKLNLSPNRVVLYLTAITDIVGVLLTVANDLALPQVVAVLGGIAAITAKALTFVKGQQQLDSALYQRDLIAYQANAQADLQDRQAQLAAEVGRPGTGRKVTLPR